MELYLVKKDSLLHPAHNSDAEQISKMKDGEVYKCVVTMPRNYEFHKRFFALVNLGHKNTSLEMPFEAYRKYVIMKAGYFTVYKTPKGVMYEADSISFGNMDEATFKEVYSRVLDVIIKDIGATSDEITEMLVGFM